VHRSRGGSTRTAPGEHCLFQQLNPVPRRRRAGPSSTRRIRSSHAWSGALYQQRRSDCSPDTNGHIVGREFCPMSVDSPQLERAMPTDLRRHGAPRPVAEAEHRRSPCRCNQMDDEVSDDTGDPSHTCRATPMRHIALQPARAAVPRNHGHRPGQFTYCTRRVRLPASISNPYHWLGRRVRSIDPSRRPVPRSPAT
jgi:hypothetical protein